MFAVIRLFGDESFQFILDFALAICWKNIILDIKFTSKYDFSKLIVTIAQVIHFHGSV